MPYLDVDGARLYYEVSGEGPALVFAHGLGGNHMSWWQQVPAFNDRYRCVVFAHRGFAPSSEDPGGPGAHAFADDLDALLDHLGKSMTSVSSPNRWVAGPVSTGLFETRLG